MDFTVGQSVDQLLGKLHFLQGGGGGGAEGAWVGWGGVGKEQGRGVIQTEDES